MIQNIPTERLRLVIEYAEKHGYEETEKTLQVKKETVKRYAREYKKRMEQKEARVTDQVVQKDKITQTVLSPAKFTNVEQLAEYCDIDVGVWKADKIRTNQWGSSKDPMWQFRVEWTRRKGLSPESAAQSVKQVLDTYTYPVGNKKKMRPIGNKMLEIAIPDLHMGRFVETEGEPYTLQTAYDRWLDAHQYFFARYEDTAIDKVIISIGNDFFNVDNGRGTTTHGTPQREQSSYQVSFEMGLRACVEAVDLWREKAPVQVVIVQGNHDNERDFYLGTALQAWYRKDEDTTIDNAHTPRKYVVYGKTLLGFSHGQKDYKRLPTVFHSEQRDALKDIHFIEFHVGHIHQERMIESAGNCVIRSVPSLASKSVWETEMGFSSLKQAMAFLWDKEKGLDTINYYTILT